MPHLPATLDDAELTGLEDFDPSTDLVMPMLRIDNDKAELVDNLSGERFDSLEVVMLGLVKQRVLWPAEMGDGEPLPPLCRSYDFLLGRPDVDRFPEKASGLKVVGDEPLDCAHCALKDWGSNPKSETSWCTEQWNFVLMTPAGDGYAPAQFTVQRSGMKDARAYLSSFQRATQPLFVCTTVITLDARKRGSVKYAVPQYKRGALTPLEYHDEWKSTYRRIREWLQTPRGRKEETGGEEPAAASTKSPAAVPDDEEVGF